MSYWAQFYDDLPDNNIAPPPNGAPEGHFPDQLNNIQRQAMAAAAEIQQLVLGPGDGSAAPQSAPTGINNDFLKIIYDGLQPIGSISAWNSRGGTNPYPVPAGSAFATVTWQICDGTNNTPDLRRKNLGGSDPDNASPLYTGDIDGSVDTGEGGAHTPTGAADGTALTGAQTGPHTHGVTEDPHIHDIEYTSDAGLEAPGPQGVKSIGGGVGVGFTVGAVTGISIDSGGGGAEHDHALTMDPTPDHTHTQDPLRTTLEFYQRIA